jgi:hypothetical protein
MKRVFRVCSALILLIFFASAFLHGQQLIVQTEGGKQVLSRADLESLPHVRVSASEGLHSTPEIDPSGIK